MLFFDSIGLLFGGGQVPHSNLLIANLIILLANQLDATIFGINHSYSGLVDESCYERMSQEKAQNIANQIGTYLGTCRKFYPAADENFDRILEMLKSHNIKTMIVCGGDGSAKGLNNLHERFETAGYNIKIIFIPCTIDGMNATETIGIKATVAESTRRVKLVAANAFATFDAGYLGPRVAIVETQGRNRDDILLKTFEQLKAGKKIGRFNFSEIKTIIIPSSLKWSIFKLLKKVESQDKPTLIIVSEGAMPEEKWFKGYHGDGIAAKIASMINNNEVRKANYDTVGYLSQSNDLIDAEQVKEVKEWAAYAVNYLVCSVNEKSYATAIIKENGRLKQMALERLVSLNPNSIEHIPLTEEQKLKLKKYLL